MPPSFEDVACTVCSCLCDDLRVECDGDRIVQVERACALAKPWFAALSRPASRPVATVEGQAVSLDDAIERAVQILRRSSAPLIWGLQRSSTAGQRAAVFLAEQIGATIDCHDLPDDASSTIAFQQVGQSTCSLGEVRNRADLVIFWRADPVATHPRHFERYSVDARGLFVPRGRADRHIVVIDSQRTATSEVADTFVELPPDADADVIAAIRLLLSGGALEPSLDVGISHEQLQSLAAQWSGCRYGAAFFGSALYRNQSGRANVEALFQLIADLNRSTRFTVRHLTRRGNAAGASSVLGRLTGFPCAVNFALGYPRYDPDEYAAHSLLERGAVDACLLVGSEPGHSMSSKARDWLAGIPTIALDYPHVEPSIRATVEITTAIYGVHAAGTAYRMDDVAIPLRQLLPANLPTDEDVLRSISSEVQRHVEQKY